MTDLNWLACPGIPCYYCKQLPFIKAYPVGNGHGDYKVWYGKTKIFNRIHYTQLLYLEKFVSIFL